MIVFDFSQTNRNKNGSYKSTVWIMRDPQNPNLPWWYCPDCNVACAHYNEHERDRSFRAHLASDICCRKRTKKKEQPK